MPDTAVLTSTRPFSPRIREELIITKGGNGPFTPLPVTEAARAEAVSLAVIYARSPTLTTSTLKASIGLMAVLNSSPHRVRYSEIAIPRPQVMAATGMDHQTVKDALLKPNAFVIQATAGMAYDYATDTAKAATWQVIVEHPVIPNYDLPTLALSPGNPLWSSKSQGPQSWRLALVLLDLQATDFTRQDLKQWTGWTDKTVRNVLDRNLDSFLTKPSHGTYRFEPSYLAQRNVPYKVTMADWVIKSGETVASMRENHARHTNPKTLQPSTPKPNLVLPNLSDARSAALNREFQQMSERERDKWKARV
jgi:hypothetical protein